MRKKRTGAALGMGLAMTAACALADTTYYATEAGYVSDNDGRVYTYVIYGTEEPAAVITHAADVNAADSRGTTASPPSEMAASRTGETPADTTVSFGKPDVNEVFGRA